MIINGGIGDLTPEQMRSELEKYRIMNEARAKKGLAPIPVPANLQSGDVRYVTVGSSTGERSPMIQTTAGEMGTAVRTLQEFISQRSKEAPPPVVLGKPAATRGRQVPKRDVVVGTPPKRPSGVVDEAVAVAMGERLSPSKPKKKVWPWLAVAGGLGGLWWWKRRRRAA